MLISSVFLGQIMVELVPSLTEYSQSSPLLIKRGRFNRLLKCFSHSFESLTPLNKFKAQDEAASRYIGKSMPHR